MRELHLLWENNMTHHIYNTGKPSLDENNIYIFEYDNSSLDNAISNGYVLHPTFPDRYKVYLSDFLFSCFSRRLPNFNRVDQKHFFEGVGSNDITDDKLFEVLGMTGGKLMSDGYLFVSDKSEYIL